MSGDGARIFGARLGDILARHDRTQSSVASGMGVTNAYISALRTGKKGVSAATVDSLADNIGATPDERVSLHRAAAVDAGFRLDLPDDF
ncbi:MAG: hypothetical protein CMO01_00200 [Thalassobius sp.]|nr:hypothetical protein [Thalassovita sp.]